jgi:hypothetical protein
MKGVSGKAVMLGVGFAAVGTLVAYWLMNNSDAVDELVNG